MFGAAGEFVKKDIAPFPGEPVSLPDRPLSNNMIQFYIADWSSNSASYVFDAAGVMTYTIKPSDIPPKFPFQLNTKYFQFIIPQLYQQYPDTDMQIDLSAANPPTTSTSASSSSSTIVADVNSVFSVISSNGTIIKVFGLELDLQMGLNAQVSTSGSVISGAVTYQSLALQLKWSNVGSFDVKLVQTLMQAVIQYGVLPIVNAITQQGFPLPSVPGLTLDNPKILYNDGYLGVASNFTYHFTEL